MTTGESEKKDNPLKQIMEWAVCIGVAVVLALGVHAWVGQLVTVDGPSMQPSLFTGEKVLIGRPEYYIKPPKRGDVLLVHYPGSRANFIKRVIAVGGETVSITGGVVFVNGKQLHEPYVVYPAETDMDETAVPQGSVFVMGDNRADSTDSRDPHVGPIPLTQVAGRAYLLVWPPARLSKLTRYDGKLEP